MAGEDGEPDVHWFEGANLLDDEADAERDRDLRDDRDVERALCVASSLQAAGVGEGDGDEEAGEREDAEQLCADRYGRGIGHAKDREQILREEEIEDADSRRTREAKLCRCVDRCESSVGLFSP